MLRSLSILQDANGDTNAKDASLKQLQCLCEEHDIDTDNDLSDSDDTPPREEDDDLVLEDLTDSGTMSPPQSYSGGWHVLRVQFSDFILHVSISFH